MITTRAFIRFLILLAGLLAWVAPFSARADYLSLYAFGDSLTDAGNAYALSGGLVPPSPPYLERFSNGPVAVEQLAASLAISGFTASHLGGTDYAVGGAETGTGNYLSLTPGLATYFDNTGIQTQVGNFVSAAPGIKPATSLFFLWGGPDDIFAALDTGAPLGTAVSNAISNVADEIVALAGTGATHFLIPNFPDLGVTPFGLATDPSGLTSLSMQFNAGLGSALDTLRSGLGLDIREFDVFDFMHEVIADPSAFGFTNVTAPCFDGASVCGDPSQYLFWDSVHPTTSADSILAARFASTVPDPTTLALVGVGLLGLGLSRRKATAGTRQAGKGEIPRRRACLFPRRNEPVAAATAVPETRLTTGICYNRLALLAELARSYAESV